jgi:histidyl-tRNA synthetase
VKNEKHKAVKGMLDILPPDIFVWQKVEKEAREVFRAYGFHEMRTPVAESTSLFTRSIGETSDIVEKEMYTFQDKGGRSISLRPEGTASIVRCYVEKNLHTLPSPQKFFYCGPMFRYERPQKGRHRQFYQIGAEAFGVGEPGVDAEMISLLMLFLNRVGLRGLSLEINSIGCQECRPDYRRALLDFLSTRLDGLCDDCKRRHTGNPLRILDCKASTCVRLRSGAPVVMDHLCTGCGAHFEDLKGALEMLQLSYRTNPMMVRGLDYYTRTTFEVTSEHLGAQNAVAAGGRYDSLVRDFGGPEVPAVGFAVGMERLISLIKENEDTSEPAPDVFIASLGPMASKEALKMADMMRAGGVWVEIGYGGSSLKSQMRKADRLNARYVLIIGDNELEKGTVNWKNLKNGDSGEIEADKALDFCIKGLQGA